MLKGIAARHPSTARNGIEGWRLRGAILFNRVTNGGAEGIGRTIQDRAARNPGASAQSRGLGFVRRRLWGSAAEKRGRVLCADATLSDKFATGAKIRHLRRNEIQNNP